MDKEFIKDASENSLKRNVQEIFIEDLPLGVPVLKWKKGLYYRPNNTGYTEHILDAGFYDREEAIKYCFDSNGKNGSCEVYAMPLWMAITQKCISRDKLKAYQLKIDILNNFVIHDKIDTVIF